MVSVELTPIIRPENPAFRKASANDPPISPTPKIATLFMPTHFKPNHAPAANHAPSKPNRVQPSRDRKGAISDNSQQLNRPIYSLRNNPQLLHQLRELLRPQRLRAIAKRVIGIVVHLYQQPVGAGGHRGARHGQNFVAAPATVRRIS